LKKYNAAYGRIFRGLRAGRRPRFCNTVAWKRARTGKCDFQRGDHRGWRFHRYRDLPENLQHHQQRTTEGDDWRPLSLEEVRKLHIQRVLNVCRGNRLRAAPNSGIGRTSLYRYLKHDGLEGKVREKPHVSAV